MEIVLLLQAFWRRRYVVLAGLLAGAAAAFVVGPGAAVRGGVATTRLVLDTPRSQLIEAAPVDADSLKWRAALLGTLLGSNNARASLAGALDVPPDRLVVVDMGFDKPAAATTLPIAASEAAAIRPERYVLVVRHDEQLPIVSLEAHAPTRGEAAKLADAAAAAFRAGSGASEDARLQAHFVVETVGPVEARDVVTRPMPVKALAVALGVMILWAGCAAFVLTVARRMRPNPRPA